MQQTFCKRPRLDESSSIPPEVGINPSIDTADRLMRYKIIQFSGNIIKLVDLPPDGWDGLLKLEHRQKGDEDRILLFAVNRTGLIGKIIFTSGFINNGHVSSNSVDEIHNMIQAKVVNIEVKEPYRGFDFGGLLFSLAMAILRHRYEQNIRCSLDAEEDVRRHNRLVSFYKDLGCAIKINAKVSYLNSPNGDQVIRKVPMQTVLTRNEKDYNRFYSWISDLSTEDGVRLTPVQFQALPLKSSNPIDVRVHSSWSECSRRPIYWLLHERPDGLLQIQTTMGDFLNLDNEGTLHQESQRRTGTEDDSLFILEHWYENKPHEAGHINAILDDFKSEALEKPKTNPWDDLWTIRSAHRNLYLSTSFLHDSNAYTTKNETTMSCSQTPVFWTLQGKSKQAGLTCICTKETPLQRFHYKEYWSIQCLQYVNRMKAFLEETLKGPNRCMTLHKALNLTRNIILKPFRKHGASSTTDISVRTMCFAMAEEARAEDYPDWFQLVALIHEVGRVCSIFDDEINRGVAFDWTISCGARVIGCRPPNTNSFSLYRHLDPDLQRFGESYSIYSRHCGLRNTLLTWTGPEYLYHLLRMNHTLLCDEALTVLRLFSLRCWHASNGEYGDIEDDDDIYMKSMINDFDRLRRRVKRTLYENVDFIQGLYSDNLCETLWRDYYSALFEKYSCDGIMQW